MFVSGIVCDEMDKNCAVCWILFVLFVYPFIFMLSYHIYRVGTERKSFKTHDEVHIPYKKPPPLSSTERFIPIKELDDYAQKAFGSIKKLNRIQSRVYDHRAVASSCCCVYVAGRVDLYASKI